MPIDGRDGEVMKQIPLIVEVGQPLSGHVAPSVDAVAEGVNALECEDRQSDRNENGGDDRGVDDMVSHKKKSFRSGHRKNDDADGDQSERKDFPSSDLLVEHADAHRGDVDIPH